MSAMIDGREGGGNLGCHAPDCREDADHLAYDKMVGLNIGFCEEHINEWASKDNIDRGDA